MVNRQIHHDENRFRDFSFREPPLLQRPVPRDRHAFSCITHPRPAHPYRARRPHNPRRDSPPAPMLTIILPTAARPAMLRKALSSVAEQSALEKIARIYVSENGGSRESEAICAQFPQLPITYLFRSPAMKPLEHGRVLMNELPEGDFTAILHDDDWWCPNHVANAVAALEAHPQASIYTSANFVVLGECATLSCTGNLFPWFGANYPEFKPVWEMSRLHVLLAEMLGTAAHYSTFVARSTALKKSAYVFDLGNRFDNDRMLLFALSKFGTMLFNPTPEVFVRNHGVQDSALFDGAAQQKAQCGTTRWILESSGESIPFIAKTFARQMAKCPKADMPMLKTLAMREWCMPEMRRVSTDPVIV